MNGTLFLIGQLIITLLALGLISSLYYGLSQAFQKLHLPALQRDKLLQLIITGIAFWLAILALLAYMGYFYEPDTTFQRLLLAVALPMAIVVLLLFSRFFTLILRELPIRWLVYFQACRIVGIPVFNGQYFSLVVHNDNPFFNGLRNNRKNDIGSNFAHRTFFFGCEFRKSPGLSPGRGIVGAY